MMDLELIKRCQKGDEEAFDALYGDCIFLTCTIFTIHVHAFYAAEGLYFI